MHFCDFYRDWLTNSHGLIVDEKGFVHVPLVDGELLPLIISADMGNGKMVEAPLVLPTEEIRRRGETGEYVRFHPLCESIFRGQSPVFNRLLTTASSRFSKLFVNLIYEAYMPLIDQSKQDKLSPAMVDFASGIGFPKSTKSRGEVLKYMASVMAETTGIKGSRYLVRFSAGRFNSSVTSPRNKPKDPMMAAALEKIAEDHPGSTRYVVMTSALYAEAVKVKAGTLKAIFGKKARTQEILETAADLIIAVFGDEPIYGCSGNNTAPYMHSLMLAMNCAAERNNYLSTALIDSGAGASDVPVSVIELMDTSINFDDLLKQYPATCMGNAGAELPTAHANLEEIELEAPVLTKPLNEDTPPWESSQTNATGQLTKPIQQPLTKQRSNDHVIANAYQGNRQTMFNIKDTAAQARTGSTYTPPASMRLAQNAKKTEPVQTAGEERVEQQRAPGRTIPAQQSTGSLQIKQPPAPKASPLRIKPAPERLVHLSDSRRNLLFNYDGSPFMVKESEVPRTGFEIEVNANNEQVFNADGTPSLVALRENTRGEADRDAPRGRQYRDDGRGRDRDRGRDRSNMTMAERISARYDDDDDYDRGRGRGRQYRDDDRDRGRGYRDDDRGGRGRGGRDTRFRRG